MIRATRAIRDALTNALEEERHYAAAIQGAEETEDWLIRGTYRVGLTPFMQPTAEYEEEEPAPKDNGKTEAENTKRTRAGRTPQST